MAVIQSPVGPITVPDNWGVGANPFNYTPPAAGAVAGGPTTPAGPTQPKGLTAANDPKNYNQAWVDNAMATIASRAPNDVDWDAYGNSNVGIKSQWANSTDPGVKAMKDAGLSFADFAKFSYANGIVNGGEAPDVSAYNINTIGAKKFAEEQDAKAKADQEKAVAKEQADKAAAAKEAARVSRNTAIGGAREQSQGKINELLTSVGLDPAKYGAQIGSYLDTITNQLYGNTDDPYADFDPNKVVQGITEPETAARRQTYGNEVASKFGPNYGDRLISDNMLDPIINSILDEQEKGATDYLKRATDRGILNETGVSGAQAKIAADRERAKATLANLAGGVIDKYQTKASDIGAKAQQGASGYTLGSNFNIGDYETQGQGVLGEATTRGGGELRSALGDQNFFDTSSLVNTAGAAQGATGLVDNTLAAAVAERKKRDNVERGLGSQGTF